MEISSKIIKEIKEEAKKYFKGAKGCHDWTHVERVRTLALKIGKKEKASLDILEIAAYLHDICRKKEIKKKGGFCHAEEGAELSRKILNKYDLGGDKIDNIFHCILTHRYRNSHTPKTIEAKVLYDSDKIDSLGAVGLSRIFLFAGHSGSGNLYTGNEERLAKDGHNYSYTTEDSAFLEYEVRLKNLYKKMLTSTGGKIARNRCLFMEKFFKQFWQEVEGKK